MSIRIKLALLLSLLFFAAIGNAVLTFVLDGYAEERLNWVVHTHEVLTKSSQFISSMTDAETGQRGYLLTSNSEYLEPYHIGVSQSKQHLSKLLMLTSDNLIQQQRLKTVETLMNKKLDDLYQTINLTKKNIPDSFTKAINIVKRTNGKKYMDSIRFELIAFNNHERLLLEQRKGEFKEYKAYISAVVGFEVLFFILMSIITALFIRNKLYQPLGMLMAGTAKMEKGEKQHIADILPNDEMGYLLSRFFRMSEVVHTKTEALNYEASHDALTGLKNRAKLESELPDSILELNDERKLAVLFIDLNNFKQQNDVLGHDAGDAILVETAKRLKNSLRSNDGVYRLGGDEFVVVLENIRNEKNAKLVVENMLENFSEPLVFQGNTISISLSIGIAMSPDQSEDSNKLLKLSDIAMYASKRDKNSSYTFFDNSMLNRESDK